MKITMLGTGNFTSSSSSASYLIDYKILLDAPNGTYKNIKRIGIEPESISNILLTHFHGDHYFDMPFLLLAILKSKYRDINIYGSRDGLRKIKRLTKLGFPRAYKDIFRDLNIHYHYQTKLTIDSYQIQKVLVNHGHMKPSYGYIFTLKDKKVGFTGDSCYCLAVKNMAKECNMMICDCSCVIGTPSHMGIDNIKELAINNPKCIFITSHMMDETKKELLKLKIANIKIGNDGDTYQI